MEDPRDLCAAH